ncbi:hypothetical protein QQ020_17195 [Fulvivirgaceae bacterium BMA12]|uniref:Lipoprotein n=1 Tax=Agaribacillus aureus TaxID=3051825 RepID=A0ABT8LBZ5_9BACT|nr:hypothetical protein [Fulvivirgaceae bacterium BMA12]
MRKYLFLLNIVWLLYLTSCVPNKTCPAFQSYFILDEKTRESQFSKFDVDSIPKFDYVVRKNKYGIIKKVSYKKKQDEWNTVEMDIIMPTLDQELDSVLLAQEFYDDSDSLLTDNKQTPQSIRRRDRYNEDQLQYMRLFGKYLRKPTEPGPLDVSEELDAPADEEVLEEPEEKKGVFGFLKKKKKDKNKEDKPAKKKKKKRKKKDLEEDVEEEPEAEDVDISDTNF